MPNRALIVGALLVWCLVVPTSAQTGPAPTGVQAVATGSSGVAISWTRGSGVAGYAVGRNCTGVPPTGGCQATSGVLPATATSWSDVDLVAETSYSYQVAVQYSDGRVGVASASATTGSSDPAVVYGGPGMIDVFAKGRDNALWHRQMRDGLWGEWLSRGGELTSGPDAVREGASSAHVVVRGTDGGVWHLRYTPGDWGGTPWSSLGGGAIGDPSVAEASGGLPVFFRGTDNAVWFRFWDRAKWNWSSLISLGGSFTSAPDGAYDGWNDHLMVFIRGTDGAVWHRSRRKGSWDAWASLGGQIIGSPGATSAGSGRFDLFARGTDNALYSRSYEKGTWGPWVSLGGGLSSGPDASALPYELGMLFGAARPIEVVVWGTDNQVWRRSKRGNPLSWHPWESLGAPPTLARVPRGLPPPPE